MWMWLVLPQNLTDQDLASGRSPFNGQTVKVMFEMYELIIHEENKKALQMITVLTNDTCLQL